MFLTGKKLIFIVCDKFIFSVMLIGMFESQHTIYYSSRGSLFIYFTLFYYHYVKHVCSPSFTEQDVTEQSPVCQCELLVLCQSTFTHEICCFYISFQILKVL